MRKVTRQIAEAFKNGERKTVGNTMTDGSSVYLHGNKIAGWNNGRLELSLAGWNTPTTRERLNGILLVFGFENGFTQKNFEPMLDGEVIDPNEFISFQ